MTLETVQFNFRLPHNRKLSIEFEQFISQPGICIVHVIEDDVMFGLPDEPKVEKVDVKLAKKLLREWLDAVE